MVSLEYFGATDAGKVRSNNEDSLLAGRGTDKTLFVVADGIGGFEAGEVASSITTEILEDLAPGDSLEEAIQRANRKILAVARSDRQFSGMGTTVVALRFSNSTAEVAHVGDSRAYLLRGGQLQQLTEDHSLVTELIRSGDITRAQAADHPQRNLITRALGAEEDVQVDVRSFKVQLADRILLCSDGLTDMVSEPEIARILKEPGDSKEVSQRLVDAALDAGGADNITVVVVDVKDTEPGPSRDRTAEIPVAVPRRSRDAGAARSTKREERRGGRVKRTLKALVRTLLVVVLLSAALTPAYLWASSRYFLGFDQGVVVIYRGLPYAPLGFKLNQEWQRTNLQESRINQPYRQQISEHRLYSKDSAEAIVRDLQSK